MSQEPKGSCLSTVPGILTGCAALVTALATLIGALVATGIIQNFIPSSVQPTPTTETVFQSPTAEIVYQSPTMSILGFENTLPAPPTLGVDTDESQLIQAIQRANSAEMQAVRTLDPGALVGAYDGAALSQEQITIQNLQGQGMVAYSTLHSQQFQSYEIDPNGYSARVRVVEVWSTQYYDAQTNTCLQSFAEHETPQTVTLERRTTGWIVTNIEFDDPVAPTPTTCY